MAGKKGRSGRKPRWYEEKYEILEGLSVDRAIEIMRNKDEDERRKDKVMMEVISKGLPQRIKHLTEDEAGETRGIAVVAYLPKVKDA